VLTACPMLSTFLSTAGNRTDEAAVKELIDLFHGTSSVLLRHEIAYTLGQMQRIDAVSFLETLLTDHDEHPITRHEAAEALGAIEAPESLRVLAKHAADSASEVSDTCGLALAQLNHQISKGACGCERRPQEALRAEAAAAVATVEQAVQEPLEHVELACRRPSSPPAESAPKYTYVSPAPAAKAAPLPTLRGQLLDQALPLFDRYRALFALRDAVPKEGEAAIRALCECLSGRHESALLKHEVAFVLGQLEHAAADEALCEAVQREDEHAMVRHEAAEALGAIGTPKAIEVLRRYSAHSEEILRESCWVALMWLE
jgi:deoxyhypusine monooxygenase